VAIEITGNDMDNTDTLLSAAFNSICDFNKSPFIGQEYVPQKSCYPQKQQGAS
jgi:hypothetical protein